MSVYADRGARVARKRSWVFRYLLAAGHVGPARRAAVPGGRAASPYATPALALVGPRWYRLRGFL